MYFFSLQIIVNKPYAKILVLSMEPLQAYVLSYLFKTSQQMFHSLTVSAELDRVDNTFMTMQDYPAL